MKSDDKYNLIREIISNNDVVLFMKGNKMFPQCGFSSLVVSVLQSLNVQFFDVNVLEDEEMRQNIKDFSDWPTIPQLYVKGEFIGGCDIVRELFQSGDLQKMLKEEKIIA